MHDAQTQDTSAIFLWSRPYFVSNGFASCACHLLPVLVDDVSGSRLAGVIEAVGARMQIPWCSLGFSDTKGGPSRSAQTNSVHGCHLFAVALDLILSTDKRRGPICWSQLGLTVVFLILAFPQRWLRPVSMTLCLALVPALAGTQLQSFTWL